MVVLHALQAIAGGLLVQGARIDRNAGRRMPGLVSAPQRTVRSITA